jgi:hypothetical protein
MTYNPPNKDIVLNVSKLPSDLSNIIYQHLRDSVIQEYKALIKTLIQRYVILTYCDGRQLAWDNDFISITDLRSLSLSYK